MVAPFPPPYGGMGLQFSQLASLLENRGLQVTRIRIEWVDENDHLRKIRRLGSFIKAGWQTFWSHGLIIHSTTGSALNGFFITFVTAAGKMSGKKVLLTIAGGDFLQFSIQANFFKRKLLSLFFTIPDVLIPVNPDMQKALLNLGINQKKIILISNALPEEVGNRTEYLLDDKFLQFCKQYHPLILYVGGMERHYGLVDLIQAVSTLQADFPNIGVAVFVKQGGNQAFEEEVQSYLETYNLTGRFLVFKSVPWIVSAMKLSNVMVRATNVFEGDSRAVREALAVGLPVVASNIGLRPEGVTLYKAGDVTGLVTAFQSVLVKPGHNDPVTDPEGEKNIQRYLALYEKLCG